MSTALLPPELLTHVLNLALPAPTSALHHSHAERYAFLRSASLVSHTWRTLAQPLLHAQVYCDTRSAASAVGLLARTLAARPDLARAVRTVQVHGARKRDEDLPREVEEVLRLARGTRRVFLASPGRVGLRVLECVPELEELAIYGGLLHLPPSPSPSDRALAPLRALSHISLCGTHLSALEPFFIPATLPALRVIAHVFSPSQLALDAFPPSLRVCSASLRALGPVAARNTLYWTRYDPPSPSLLGFPSAAGARWEDEVHHLRLTDVWAREARAALAEWVRALPRLETLFVQSTLLRPAEGAEGDELQRLCDVRGVRVREDLDEGAYMWGSVVPLSWR